MDWGQLLKTGGEIAKVIGIIRIHGTALAVGFSLTVCISVIIVLIGTLQTV